MTRNEEMSLTRVEEKTMNKRGRIDLWSIYITHIRARDDFRTSSNAYNAIVAHHISPRMIRREDVVLS